MLKAPGTAVRNLAVSALIGLLLAGGAACAAHRAVSGLAADRSDRSVTAHSAGAVVSGLPGSWKRQRAQHLRKFRLQSVSCSPDGRHCLAVGVFCVWATCPGTRRGAGHRRRRFGLGAQTAPLRGYASAATSWVI